MAREDYLGPENLLQKKKEYLIPCVYHFYQDPPQIVRGQGQYLYDHTGKKYLDFYAGVSVVNAGHCHPEITKMAIEQLIELQHTTTIYLTQPMLVLAEKLAQLTPGTLKQSFFCNSGSEANEGATLLAKLATKRRKFLALKNSLHGRTYLTMSLTGLSFWRTEPEPLPQVHFAPSPYCYRCELGFSNPNSCGLACVEKLEQIILDNQPDDIAALIAEPIQGNGGIIVPPADYFTQVKEILDKYGILLIIDEVQTGFNRTGKTFAIEHWGVEPDIMTLAKSLANGLPIGVFITNNHIAQHYTRPGASTFGGNPVIASAALATLEVHQKEGLANKAKVNGDYFKTRLLELQEKHPIIGEVRGKGLMLGIELVKDDKAPASLMLDQMLEYLKDQGILAGKTGPGRNVLTFQPPLIIEQKDIDYAIRCLDHTLATFSTEVIA
jgi:4-aminobutyrate aminotransferase/4-aminobutyrate aminotransferase/(S)-3-amino-2-methylpropionate transaminase